MSHSLTALLVAVSLLAVGLHQILGAPITSPDDDPIYNQFKGLIELNKQFALAKLNFTRDILTNNTKFYNIPSDSEINSTLIDCFENATLTYPGGEEYCVQQAGEDMKQTIYDSQQELGFCSNLTNSWAKITELFGQAEVAITDLETVADNILAVAVNCSLRYHTNQNKEYQCMLAAQKSHNGEWTSATSLVDQTYYGLSGISLLLQSEVKSCEEAETNSLGKKCDSITTEVKACLDAQIS